MSEIDWESWSVDEPPQGFVDRVMVAVQALNVGRRRHFDRALARKIATLTAAAVAVASVAVLAAIGRKERKQAASLETGAALDARTPSSSLAPAVMGDRAPVRAPVTHASGTIVDRKLRDEVRSKIMPVLEARGAERDPRTGLTIPSGAPAAHNLTPAYIQSRVREDFYPLARSCYEAALAKQPKLRGRIVLDFMIVGDAKVGGIVDQAKVDEKSDIDDPEFSTCMRESMLSMVFEPPENDGWVTVSYPITFAPGDEDSDAGR